MFSWAIAASAETVVASSAESPTLCVGQDNAQVSPLRISANPGAVNQITGTGQAREWLGFKIFGRLASRRMRIAFLNAFAMQTRAGEIAIAVLT